MRIAKLDGLRGIFSLMIVFLHYDKRLLPDFLAENFIIRESWVFVEFFFVLSGFVISHNYYKLSGHDELKLFLKKRFIRLYPLLLFSTLVFLFFELFSNIFLVNYINTPESIESLIYKTIDTLLLTNSTPLFGSSMGMNGPSWSISSEMISYFIFGLIVFKSNKKYRILFFIPLIIFSGWFQIIFKEKGVDLSFLRGILSFSLGVLLYKINTIKFRISNHFEFIIPAAVIYIMYLINSYSIYNQYHKIITLNLVFFLSIGILLKTNGLISGVLQKSFFQYLGKISYSIYLNHFILITLFTRLIFGVINVEQTIFSQLLILILSLVIVLIYSNITHKYLEIRIGKYLKNKI